MADEPNRITIVVHKPGIWIWIIPFSTGVTSLGYVGDPSFFRDFSGTPEEQFRQMIAGDPYLEERFKDVELLFEPGLSSNSSPTFSALGVMLMLLPAES